MQSPVRYGTQKAQLTLIVVRGSGPSLLGRDWLRAILLNWQDVNNLNASDQLRKLLKDYGDLFALELGKLKGTEVELDIDPNAIRKFVNAHLVTFSLRGKVDRSGVLIGC